MSYILDALRKADAERARGAVPGLHSHPLPQPVAAGTPAAGGGPSWRLAVVVGLVITVAVGAWWLLAPRGAADADAPSGADSSRAAAPAPVSAAAATAVVKEGPAVGLAPSPAPAKSIVVPAPPPAPVPPTETEAEAPVGQVLPPQPAARSPVAGAAATPSRAVPPPGSAVYVMPPGGADPDPTEGRVPLLSELPEATRRQLPPLKLGGSVYSEQAASRFVMIDGQLLREGDAFGAGLVVERIGPRSVRIFWRESRFEIHW
jgi:general secretion pathway protein B